jgi:hypothetical protein
MLAAVERVEAGGEPLGAELLRNDVLGERLESLGVPWSGGGPYGDGAVPAASRGRPAIWLEAMCREAACGPVLCPEAPPLTPARASRMSLRVPAPGVLGGNSAAAASERELRYWWGLFSSSLFFTLPIFFVAMVMPMVPGKSRPGRGQGRGNGSGRSGQRAEGAGWLSRATGCIWNERSGRGACGPASAVALLSVDTPRVLCPSFALPRWPPYLRHGGHHHHAHPGLPL